MELRSWGKKLLACAVSASLAVSLGQAPLATADIQYGHNIGGRILDELYAASAYRGMTYQDFFGPAISPENNASRGGKYQAFTNDNSIYWNDEISDGQANQIGGAIRSHWIASGYENGSLGYPTTRELFTRNSGHSGMSGVFNHFEGGSIYYSQRYGPNIVWGAIRDTWAAQDWEAGPLGFPRGQEVRCYTGVGNAAYGGFAQRFEGRWVYWNTPGPQTLDYDAVSLSSSGDRRIRLEGDTKYDNELSRAASKWNEMGSVDVRPRTFGEARDLHATDSYEPDATWLGIFSYRPSDYSYLWFNSGNLDKPSNRNRAVYYTAAHELGHALGLEHTCEGQLMAPTSPPAVSDGSVQFGELDHISYRNNWGF